MLKNVEKWPFLAVFWCHRKVPKIVFFDDFCTFIETPNIECVYASMIALCFTLHLTSTSWWSRKKSPKITIFGVPPRRASGTGSSQGPGGRAKMANFSTIWCATSNHKDHVQHDQKICVTNRQQKCSKKKKKKLQHEGAHEGVSRRDATELAETCPRTGSRQGRDGGSEIQNQTGPRIATQWGSQGRGNLNSEWRTSFNFWSLGFDRWVWCVDQHLERRECVKSWIHKIDSRIDYGFEKCVTHVWSDFMTTS